ncbi:hypothetical protein ACSFB8_03575 [Enterococcus faecalis]
MKKTTIIAGLLIVSGVTILLFINNSIQRKTSNAQTKVEVVKKFTKVELEKATNLTLEPNSVDSVYKVLKQPTIWQKFNYTQKEAQRIGRRFSQSKQQATAILLEIANSYKVQLKVVMAKHLKTQKVNIGSYYAENRTTDKAQQLANTFSEKLPGIKELAVEIEANHQEIAFEYQVKLSQKVQASYTNDFAKNHLEESTAQSKIETVMSGLDLKNSSHEAIKNHVMKATDSVVNIQKFKLKAELIDQRIIEFKEK